MLLTTRDVIGSLGGIRAVADLTGRSYDAAEAWQRFETFPPDTYLVLLEALRSKGLEAPNSLWRMMEPSQP